MSKQIKLKFKKLLKKAEFVQADLQYHEELLSDAKQEFFMAAQKVLDSLPPEVQKKINDERNKKIITRNKEEEDKASEDTDEEEGPPLSKLLMTEEFPEGIELNQAMGKAEMPEIKESEVKKMFRAIATVTHPDKLTKSVSKREKKKLDQIFKKAKDAYESNNWYVLYSLSLDLDLDVPEPTDEHLSWLEEDIKLTAGRVSHMGGLLVWVWYTGDEDSKKFALRNYFEQVYDYTIDI